MIPLHDDNPTEIKPIVTIGLIVSCVLVFLRQGSLPMRAAEAFVYQFGAIPAVVFGHAELPPELGAVPPYGSLISSMFLHGETTAGTHPAPRRWHHWPQPWEWWN